MDIPENPSEFFHSFGPHILTPHAFRFGWISKELSIAYELSDGSGIDPETTIYGVTVAEWIHGEPKLATNLDKVFNDPQEAEEYIIWLKEGGYLNIDSPIKDYDEDEPYAGLYGIDFDS